MARNSVDIIRSCKGLCSCSRPRHRLVKLERCITDSSDNLSIVNSAYSLPSFDLGIDCISSQDSNVVVYNSVIISKVSKRARLDKRIAVENSADHVSVVIGGEHCKLFTEIHLTLQSTSLQSTSLIGGSSMHDTRARLITLVISNCIPIVEHPQSDFEDNCIEVPVNNVCISEITSNSEALGLVEMDFAIIEEPILLLINDPVNQCQSLSHVLIEPDKLAVNCNDSEFYKFDQASFDREMRSCNKNGTTKSNSWVANRFNAWRCASGLDLSIPIESLPLKELAQMLVKFFFVLKKKNGKHYPSQSIMEIYKGFNRIMCKVQSNRIDETGVNEEQFVMHSYPFFSRVNKFVILAMRKSIMAGANKERRKVDYFTDDDELKILAHPKHQVTFPTSVQKRFVWFCTTVFLIRGNNELYSLRLVDFTLGTDERGRETLRYNETLSKNYKPTLTKYQAEYFRDLVYSQNEDVIVTFKVLLAHMPLNPKSDHLFLSPIKNPKDRVWFKGIINLGEGSLRHFVRDMVATIGLEGDYSNKSGRVTTITRMSIICVQPETIASSTGHKSLSSVQRYNRIECLKTRVAQNLARPSVHGDFQSEYELEVIEWHKANKSADNQGTINLTEENGGCHEISFEFTASSSFLAQIESVTELSLLSNLGPSLTSDPRGPSPSSNPSPSPSSNPSNDPIQQTVNSELDDLISYNPPSQIRVSTTNATRPSFYANDGISTPTGPAPPFDPIHASTLHTPTHMPTVPAPIPTIVASSRALVEEEMLFWSKFNFEEEGEDFCLPAETVAEAPQGTRFAMHRNVALLRRENAILKNSLSQVMHQQSSLEEQLKRIGSEQRQFQNQVPRNPRYSSYFPSSQMNRTAQNQQSFSMAHPVSYSFPNGQGLNSFNQGISNLQHPFAVPQFQGLPNSFPSSSVPLIAPIYGNSVYNYQSFDVGRFSGGDNVQGSFAWNS